MEGIGDARPDVRPDGGPDGGRSILLVEDEPLILALATDILEDDGYRVVGCASAEEAIAAVEAGLRPDAMLCDQSLPGMCGGDLADYLRDRIGLGAIAIVSGSSDTGGRGYPMLAKPWVAEQLLTQVRSLLDAAAAE